MKTIRSFGVALMTMLLSVSYSACSSSSDDDSKNSGGEITPEPVVEKQLKSYGSYKFEYDEQGRITSCTDGRNKNVTYTYNDNDNNITVMYTSEWVVEGELHDIKRTYTLLSGRVSKTSIRGIEYDSNGYVLSVASNDKIVWLDGDLIEIHYSSVPRKNRTFKYTNIPWPKNFVFVLDYFYDYPMELLLHMGYMGKQTKFLPSEMVYSVKNSEQITFKYNWTIKDGYPTQVKISSSNGNDESLIFNYQ